MIASAERMIRFTFNSTQTCTDADAVKIGAIFNPAVRRQLRESNNAHRGLNQYCKENCGSVVAPRCYATGCAGYTGRRLSSLEDNNDRDLQNINSTCRENVFALNAKIDLLIKNNEVSESCKLFLATPNRRRECYDDVMYGLIETIRVWNMTDPTAPTLITDNMRNSFSICNTQAFTIEAKVNSCVDYVNFQMVGASSSSSGYFLNRTEDNAPFTVFDSASQGNMVGVKLDKWGGYNLTITPDGFESKKKFVSFWVMGRC
jgi:hypothetical protein